VPNYFGLLLNISAVLWIVTIADSLNYYLLLLFDMTQVKTGTQKLKTSTAVSHL